MILVLLGTQHNEFTRLLQEIDECIKSKKIDEEVIVQAGFTKYESKKMRIFDMIPKLDLDEFVERADLVITHGGVGSIIMALNKNKKVIAVPRLHEYGEHVNDHQRQIIKVFSEKGYLIGVQNVEDMPEALKDIKTFVPKKYENNNHEMLNYIENFIANI
jgi:UDP-N-acetylglucosamine transferase subunit ALG13